MPAATVGTAPCLRRQRFPQIACPAAGKWCQRSCPGFGFCLCQKSQYPLLFFVFDVQEFVDGTLRQVLAAAGPQELQNAFLASTVYGVVQEQGKAGSLEAILQELASAAEPTGKRWRPA